MERKTLTIIPGSIDDYVRRLQLDLVYDIVKIMCRGKVKREEGRVICYEEDRIVTIEVMKR